MEIIKEKEKTMKQLMDTLVTLGDARSNSQRTSPSEAEAEEMDVVDKESHH